MNINKALFMMFVLTSAGCNESNLTVSNSSFTAEQVCRAGVALIMGRSPAEMSAKRTGSYIHVWYRNADNSYKINDDKCKLSGNRLYWGMLDGRWRDSSYDSVVTFSINGSELTITEKFGDGSGKKKRYSHGQL